MVLLCSVNIDGVFVRSSFFALTAAIFSLILLWFSLDCFRCNLFWEFSFVCLFVFLFRFFVVDIILL